MKQPRRQLNTSDIVVNVNRGGQIYLPRPEPTAGVAMMSRSLVLKEKLQLLERLFPRMDSYLIEDVLCSHALDVVGSVEELSFLDHMEGEEDTRDCDFVQVVMAPVDCKQAADVGWNMVPEEEWEVIDDVGNCVVTYSDIAKACIDKQVSQEDVQKPLKQQKQQKKQQYQQQQQPLAPTRSMVIHEPGYDEQKARGQRRTTQLKKFKRAQRMAREKKKQNKK